MRIGAQLYSVRSLCGTTDGLLRVMDRMREIGYRSVQLSGFPFDAESVRRHADELGLHIGLTHASIDALRQETERLIDTHHILGADMIGLGYPHGYTDGRTIRVRELLEALRGPAEKIRAAGLRFGYHNHDMEFRTEDGRTALETLAAETDWEFILDVGWMHRAGADDAAVIRSLTGRLRYVHLKDFRLPRSPEEPALDGCVPLYAGVTPLDEILTALDAAGTAAAYVEQDNAMDSGDGLEQLRRSFLVLREHGWC